MDHQALEVEENELLDLGIVILDKEKIATVKNKGKLEPGSTPRQKKQSITMQKDIISPRTNTVKTKFSSEMDLDLLREVCVSRPFFGKYKEIAGNWEKVRNHLGWADISSLTIRRRFGLLLSKFKSDETNSRLTSGDDESYDEATQLLTDIKEFMDCSKDVTDKEITEKENQAEEIREAALEGLTGPSKVKSAVEEPLRTKNKHADELATAFMEKNKNEFVLKEKELDFKKGKFEKIMEDKERDRVERDADRKLELRRIEALEIANQNQHLLMMKLIESLTSKK